MEFTRDWIAQHGSSELKTIVVYIDEGDYDKKITIPKEEETYEQKTNINAIRSHRPNA